MENLKTFQRYGILITWYIEFETTNFKLLTHFFEFKEKSDYEVTIIRFFAEVPIILRTLK